jgi:hypothetical protein
MAAPLPVTVSATVAVCVALVPAPVTVSVYVPGAALPAFTVSVEEPPAVTDVGLSEAVAPEGAPVTERATVCAEPEVTAVLMVEVPDAFAASDRLDGVADIEKSFVTVPVTVSVTVVVCVALVPVPVTVTV